MTSSNVSLCRFIAAVAVALPLAAQLPTMGQLNDAQAVAMIQAISGQAQNGTAPAITQAQLQLLLQYMARQSAASPANATQAQMLMQALAQSSASAPTAAVSAAQAQSLAQMFAAQSVGATPVMRRSPGGSAMPPIPQPQGLPVSQAAGLGPKKPGTIRIGVLTPRSQLTQNGQGANDAEMLRATIVRYLSGPMLEVTSISAMLPQQAEAEAKQKECDYVLYSSLTQKLNSGGGLGLLKKAMPAASMIPMIGMAGGMAGAAASAAAGAAAGQAASIAGAVKAKGEVTFEYKLITPEIGAAIVGNSSTAKARTDGEDIITPLVEQADTAILFAVTKNK